MTHRVKLRPGLREQITQEGITESELSVLTDDLIRIARLDWPCADWMVQAIRCTEGAWHRVRNPDQPWRAIIEIDDGAKTITLLLVLLRDDETYKIVERAWLANRQPARS